MSTGKIVQVMGPVVDVEFETEELPEIFSALEIKLEGDSRPVSYTHLTLPTKA